MKKRFTKILSLVLVAVAAMSLSITSFAADNKPAPITPTAETTLGDVCRHFEPEWFAALPTDICRNYTMKHHYSSRQKTPTLKTQKGSF